jgi:hypothetical protein
MSCSPAINDAAADRNSTPTIVAVALVDIPIRTSRRPFACGLKRASEMPQTSLTLAAVPTSYCARSRCPRSSKPESSRGRSCSRRRSSSVWLSAMAFLAPSMRVRKRSASSSSASGCLFRRELPESGPLRLPAPRVLICGEEQDEASSDRARDKNMACCSHARY